MSIEQSIDKLADAITALAQAVSGGASAQAVSGGASAQPPGKPAATQTAKATAAKTETATASPSEGNAGAAVAEKPAPTPHTAKDEDAATQKALDYVKDIKPAFLKLIEVKGRDAGLAFIAGYDPTPGKRLNEVVEPDDYPKVLAALNELLEG